MTGWQTLSVLTGNFVVACFTAWLASQKGRGVGAWFLLGFFFSIVALLTLMAAPRIQSDEPRGWRSVDRETGWKPFVPGRGERAFREGSDN